ncbi:hypothetical protein SAY87_002798 [Trapa incisa]|uniref:G protein gamma domain-containing protein n=2 Tax=Trapa TaxID=22665 RepID=A0AAN7QED3_TRANT|nr:hypothetical protein SAY87_002798 [Trapa incisa]KAK4764959.1 hypothetical protein SAY86_026049 [Trapa natans]
METVAVVDSGAAPLVRLQSIGVTDTRGKHRVQAELKRLEQEARSLEEELDQLEKMDAASISCKEMLNIVETKSDPLLSLTVGPLNPQWDRWFEGPQEVQGCSCLIM